LFAVAWWFYPMAKTVLVVDDSAVIRHALCEVFTSESDFCVCGEAENGREAIEKAQTLQPDLIVVDLSMPITNGIDAVRTLPRLMPTVPLIMFAVYSDVLSAEDAHSAGVSAVISKSEHASVLLSGALGERPEPIAGPVRHPCDSLGSKRPPASVASIW